MGALFAVWEFLFPGPTNPRKKMGNAIGSPDEFLSKFPGSMACGCREVNPRVTRKQRGLKLCFGFQCRRPSFGRASTGWVQSIRAERKKKKKIEGHRPSITNGDTRGPETNIFQSTSQQIWMAGCVSSHFSVLCRFVGLQGSSVER